MPHRRTAVRWALAACAFFAWGSGTPASAGEEGDDALEGAQVGLAVGVTAPKFSAKVSNPERAGTKFFALKKLVGADREGETKAVLLSFTASYCAPCRKEAQALQKHAARIKAGNVVIATIVIDRDKSGQDAMVRFLAEEVDLPFPVLVDKYGILARRYRAETLPYLVVVDPDTGHVRETHIGYHEGALEALLRKLGVKGV